MYKLRTACRACGLGSTQDTLKQSTAAGDIYSKAAELIPVVDLGVQPLANDFVKPGEECAGYAPLKVLFCPRCHLGQLSVEVSPEILYAKKYPYVTSTSKTMQEHFIRLEKDIGDRCQKCWSVVEIGSNDGLLLEHFLSSGWQTALGIDPAPNLTEASRERGIKTVRGFFDDNSAVVIAKITGSPDLIIARHCFCHVNDWRAFVKGLEIIAGPETLIAIEVPWAQQMLEQVELDTIYHEHTSYLSLKSIEYLLRDSTLCLDEVIDYDIHGGAVLLILRNRKVATQARAQERISEEKINLKMWHGFAEHSDLNVMELSGLVLKLVDQGKKVVGYGASAKSTVWVSACGFTKREVSFICDNTRWKQYTRSPGSDIPIVDEGALTRELPDYAIMFCWNFSTEVMMKEAIFRSKGGKWILPRKEIQVV